MRSYTAVIERDQETKLFVGYVPGWAGAHAQGASLDELGARVDGGSARRRGPRVPRGSGGGRGSGRSPTPG